MIKANFHHILIRSFVRAEESVTPRLSDMPRHLLVVVGGGILRSTLLQHDLLFDQLSCKFENIGGTMPPIGTSLSRLHLSPSTALSIGTHH